MSTLHIEHPISDLKTWLAAFARFDEARTKAGFRASTNPSMIANILSSIWISMRLTTLSDSKSSWNPTCGHPGTRRRGSPVRHKPGCCNPLRPETSLKNCATVGGLGRSLALAMAAPGISLEARAARVPRSNNRPPVAPPFAGFRGASPSAFIRHSKRSKETCIFTPPCRRPSHSPRPAKHLLLVQ